MQILDVLWLDAIVEKLAVKHGVESYEVEEVFQNRPKFRFVEKGKCQNEDVYMALGQTTAGRYLAVLFIHKQSGDALILSARDMTRTERRRYGRK